MMYAPTEEKVVYRDTRVVPHWYCVKTTMHCTGKIESEIVKDEKTKLPIVLQTDEKPQDGVFETPSATTYYSYFDGYKAAARQVEAVHETWLDMLNAYASAL